MANYKVLLINELEGALPEEEAKTRLQRKFKLSDEKLAKLLSKKKTVLKTDIEEGLAKKYQTIVKKCGFVCEIISIEAEKNTHMELALVEQADPEVSPELNPDNPSNHATLPATSSNNDFARENAYQAPEANMEKSVFCRECGKSILASDSSCFHCGASVQHVSGRSKVAAGFLAFFFGGFGIHRFYLNQWWGIFYIPFAFVGISGFVAWAESIYFWCCSREHWNQRYGALPPASGVLWLLLLIFPIVFVVGILAAIAVPAYQDYAIRAKVAEGILVLDERAEVVGSFIVKTGFIPFSNLDAGLSADIVSDFLDSADVKEGGKIIGTFKPLSAGSEPFTIIYEPIFEKVADSYSHVSWSCIAGTMPDKYRPARCRASSTEVQSKKSNQQFKVLKSSFGGAQIRVPSSWKSNIVQHEEASIKAGNGSQEAYVMVLEVSASEAGADSLENYASQIIQYYIGGAFDQSVLLESGLIASERGKEGLLYKLSANISGLDVRYDIAFYKSGDMFYQVLTWSLSSHYSKNRSVLRKVITSFEIKKDP